REGAHPGALAGREHDGLHSAPWTVERTVPYISFARDASRASATTRIFGSVPENRTSAQPSSKRTRHPSSVSISPDIAGRDDASLLSIAALLAGSTGTAPRIVGYVGRSRTSASSGRSDTRVTSFAAAYTPSGQ